LPYVYWKIRRRHHCSYDFLNVVVSEPRAEEMEMGACVEERGEKRETDEMVAMSMGEEECQVEGRMVGGLL
jgi:hypothetical protein